MIFLVFIEIDDETREIASVSYELLRIGRMFVSEIGGIVSALIIGYDLKKLSEDIARYAEEVYVVDNSRLKDFDPELYVYVLEKVINHIHPTHIMIAHTNKGVEIAPRISAKLKLPLTTDCVGLELEPGTGLLKREKQVFGGSVVATHVCEGFPQLVTVRPKAFKQITECMGKKGEVFTLNFKIDNFTSRVKVIEKVREEIVNLDDAEVVIAGGRGLGGPEGFSELEKLKRILEKFFRKVEIGSSRPPVDKGWIQPSRQIGLTGIKVSPALYIAVGILGATQHIVGMENSRVVIAINKDPKAPIFSNSNYGVVADYKEFLPTFIRELEKLL